MTPKKRHPFKKPKRLIKFPYSRKRANQAINPVWPKRLIKSSRIGIYFALLFLGLWTFSSSFPPPCPTAGEPPLLYSNQCEDDLRKLHICAITEAKKSILLYIYSLTDPKIIKALNERAAAGVQITVIHDASTFQKGFENLDARIKQKIKENTGLMHRKTLVIDGEKVFIGSANYSKESMVFHDNLVIGMECRELAEKIASPKSIPVHAFLVGGQAIEYWSLPEEKEEALPRLITLLNGAEKTIRVAMFTFTHPSLSDCLIEASRRGLQVEVVMDQGQSSGPNKSLLAKLVLAGLPVRINHGSELLHHKFALIDDKILISGSANWTKAAFTKNDECFVVIHDLMEKQSAKMEHLWHIIRATSVMTYEDDLAHLEEKKSTKAA